MDSRIINKVPKLQPPKLNNIYQRERLFNVLSEHEHQRAIWLASPAGSGKTTIIASYLEKIKKPLIWYQIDEGDADVALFFHYLGICENKLNAGKFKTLPKLTAEYQQNPSIYTRNYFREFFSRIDKSSVLVFDNYQDDYFFHCII